MNAVGLLQHGDLRNVPLDPHVRRRSTEARRVLVAADGGDDVDRLTGDCFDDRLEDPRFRVSDRAQRGQHERAISRRVEASPDATRGVTAGVVSDEVRRGRMNVAVVPARRHEPQGRLRYIICAEGSGSSPRRSRQPVEHVRDDVASIVERLHEPVAIDACGDVEALGHQASGELRGLADDDVRSPGARMPLEVGQHRLDRATGEDVAMRPSPSVRIGARRRAGEELRERLRATGEVLRTGRRHRLGERRRAAHGDVVAGIGDGFGERQQRVEVPGRRQARQNRTRIGR